MDLNMAMKILGGEGANRLQRVLRSERGLTYGASADLETLKQSGDFMAETDTRSESTAESLRVVVDEFWRLRRERVNRAELEGAQDYLAGSFPLTIETPSAIALQVLNALFYELDLRDLQTFPDRVRAVTPGDIQRVAEEYLKPDRLSIVLVGDADKFTGQLRGAGFDKVERIPLAELDLSSPDLRRHARQLPQPAASRGPGPVPMPVVFRGRAQAGDDQAARALVQRAIDAIGGLQALRRVKTLRAKATTTVIGPSGPIKTETVTSIAYPERFRVEASLPTGRVVQVSVGGEAWLEDPSGVRDAPPPMRDDMRAVVQRDPIRLLLDAFDGRAKVGALPDVTSEEGRRLSAEITPPNGQPVTARFEVGSGRLVGLEWSAPGPAGRRSAIEERFSDYRAVNGVQIAFGGEVRRDGVVVTERAVAQVEINVALDPAIFAKPSR
jgi:hypothetical protein